MVRIKEGKIYFYNFSLVNILGGVDVWMAGNFLALLLFDWSSPNAKQTSIFPEFEFKLKTFWNTWSPI